MPPPRWRLSQSNRSEPNLSGRVTLTLDGELQRGGTYGGPDSTARHKPQRGDGTYWFSGSGRLCVGGVSDGTTILFR